MKVTGFFFAFLALLAMASSALNECPEQDGEWAVSIVNPEDCRTFYICDRGTPVLTSCPENLAYNEAEGVCDYPNTDDGCHLNKELLY